MKRMMVGMLILSISLALAGVVEGRLDDNVLINESVKVSGIEYDHPDGIEHHAAPMAVDVSKLENTDDPTSYRSLTPGHKVLDHTEKGSMWFDWDNDVLVYPGEVGEGQDWDYDVTNGHIYAIFDTYHTTDDSLVVYRSTDGGTSFQWWRASWPLMCPPSTPPGCSALQWPGAALRIDRGARPTEPSRLRRHRALVKPWRL